MANTRSVNYPHGANPWPYKSSGPKHYHRQNYTNIGDALRHYNSGYSHKNHNEKVSSFTNFLSAFNIIAAPLAGIFMSAAGMGMFGNKDSKINNTEPTDTNTNKKDETTDKLLKDYSNGLLVKAEEEIKKFDTTTKDKKIDKEEFTTVETASIKSAEEKKTATDNFSKAFTAVDLNNDGYVDNKEYAAFMAYTSENKKGEGTENFANATMGTQDINKVKNEIKLIYGKLFPAVTTEE